MDNPLTRTVLFTGRPLVRPSITALSRLNDYLLAIMLVYNNGSWLAFEYRYLGIAFMLGFLTVKIGLASLSASLRAPNLMIVFLAAFPLVSAAFNTGEALNLPSVALNALLYGLLGFLSASSLKELAILCAKVIFFLLIVSIPMGVIGLINYDFIRSFHPSSHPGFNGTYYNFLVYTDRQINDMRVQSVFWEPGAWIFNLAFSMYWVVSVLKDKSKYPFYFLGFALALSTTGFMLLACHYVAMVIGSNRIRAVLSSAILPLTLVAIAVAMTPIIEKQAGFPISEYAMEMIVGKFSGGKYAHSLNKRKESTEAAFQVALENPFFGIGKQTDASKMFVTSSIPEFGYQFGLVYLLVFAVVVCRAYSELIFPLGCVYALAWLNGEALASGAICSLMLVIGAKLPIHMGGVHHSIGKILGRVTPT